MKFWNVRRIAFALLSVFAASAFAQTMADAQKAYVAGKWQRVRADDGGCTEGLRCRQVARSRLRL